MEPEGAGANLPRLAHMTKGNDMGRKAKDVVLPESEMHRLRAEFRAVFIKDDGWQAYLEGQPFDANPHGYDTDGQMTWAQGWMAAQACLKDSGGNPYNITITERT